MSLDKFEFDDIPLSIDGTILCSVRMFVDLGLVNEFHMDMKVHTEGNFDHLSIIEMSIINTCVIHNNYTRSYYRIIISSVHTFMCLCSFLVSFSLDFNCQEELQTSYLP